MSARWGRLLRRYWLGIRGAVAVEFALLAPILALLALGVYDFGSYTVQKQRLASSAREAAQYALVAADYFFGCRSQYGATGACASDSTVNTALNDAVAVGLRSAPAGTTASGASAIFQCTCGGVATDCKLPSCTAPKAYVSVRMTGTYPVLLPYPGIPASVAMSASAVIRQE
jgi:Flp pilus assembly protein TadG